MRKNLILSDITFNLQMIESQKKLLQKVILSDYKETDKDNFCNKINATLIELYNDTRGLKERLNCVLPNDVNELFNKLIPCIISVSSNNDFYLNTYA